MTVCTLLYLLACAFSAVLAVATSQKQHVPLPPASELTQVFDFGPNPTNVGMYAYIPANVAKNPALIMALHYCGGTAQDFFNSTEYPALSEEKKSFILLYGDCPRVNGSKCWDVSTPETLKHDAGGDSLGVASAIRFAIRNWNVDPRKVFVTGRSSGAMMTNVMLGSYPELFKAGAASSGVAFGCFRSPTGIRGWSDQCAAGQLIMTGRQWGNQVRAAFPGYIGPRPKMQLWHGTADDTLNYQNFAEEIKEWTNVFGISEVPTDTEDSDPEALYTHTVYGRGQLEAYSVEDGPHNLPLHEDRVLHFFEL
ncbi:hypothetical protein VKT23_006551 [Stygiomarasmius scandens]|uniref:Carboxylic ester hydrolase n=1 Tax=Marasmiellus scandens TaxID=2682957 RepID=A0ABR1JRF6_9AGAR